MASTPNSKILPKTMNSTTNSNEANTIVSDKENTSSNGACACACACPASVDLCCLECDEAMATHHCLDCDIKCCLTCRKEAHEDETVRVYGRNIRK